MDYSPVLYCIIAGLFLLCFRQPLIKLYNPFYGSRLQIVMKCKGRCGDTIYIFRWRPYIEKDDTPVWEMGKCDIRFASEQDLKDQISNPKLLKSYSISTWDDNRVITLEVNNVLPHEVYVNHRIPNNSMDLYAGIRSSRALQRKEFGPAPSAIQIKVG